VIMSDGSEVEISAAYKEELIRKIS
jgi:hypothetical protein